MDEMSWIGVEKRFTIDFEKVWGQRVECMSGMISQNASSVLDLGCGNMNLKKNLNRGVQYYGVDYCRRSDDTIICDFNKKEFPKITADTVFASGVLEHIEDYDWFIERMCNSALQEVVLSYVVAEEGHRDASREIKQYGYHVTWKNSLSYQDILERFQEHCFFIAKRKQLSPGQCAMKFVKCNEENIIRKLNHMVELEEIVSIEKRKSKNAREQLFACIMEMGQISQSRGIDLEIVLFGAGKCFYDHAERIKRSHKVQYICDNDSGKWNTQIGGITCISPKQLEMMKNQLVVLCFYDDVKKLEVSEQLLNMKVSRFVSLKNWLPYIEAMQEKEN